MAEIKVLPAVTSHTAGHRRGWKKRRDEGGVTLSHFRGGKRGGGRVFEIVVVTLVLLPSLQIVREKERRKVKRRKKGTG